MSFSDYAMPGVKNIDNYSYLNLRSSFKNNLYFSYSIQDFFTKALTFHRKILRK